jgi:VanZ family protein
VSRLRTWLPPVVWTAVVLAMSSAEFSAAKTGGVLHPLLAWLAPGLRPHHVDAIHGVARKAAHFIEYAILAALWFRALARSGSTRTVAAWGALAVSVACAVLDESLQAAVPTRTGSPADVTLDSLGALAAIIPARLGWRRAADTATGVLLWIAVVGGAVALAVELAAGSGAGLRWLTAPAAAALLVYRRRRARRGEGAPPLRD